MRILAKLYMLFLTPILTFGQSNNPSVKSNLDIHDYSNSRFDIDSNGFHGKNTADTSWYTDGKMASIVSYALAKNGRLSGNKFGLYTKYYHNGQIASQGNYAINSLLYYRSPAKAQRVEQSYKDGVWIYYYENGQIKAKGKYQIITSNASTGIPHQFKKTSTSTNDWLFFNPDGSKAIDIERLITDIEYNPNCD